MPSMGPRPSGSRWRTPELTPSNPTARDRSISTVEIRLLLRWSLTPSTPLRNRQEPSTWWGLTAPTPTTEVVQPAACALSTLSGEWPFSANGNSLAGATNTGVVDLAGVLQFDGQGNVIANWTQASNTATANVSATGTYTVNGACLGSLNLTDTANQTYAGSVSVFGVAANNFEWIAANSQSIFTGVGRAAFVNPGQAVVNAASYLPGQTPAGSVFSVFGSNLATRAGQATSTPLPTTVLTTTVTVNGEPAPLFYVDPSQINAQMPEDIKAGVATVVVKNGPSTSTAVAVMVPATGTPGIEVYGDNRAVV